MGEVLLSQLKKGERAVIKSIKSSPILKRFTELGLTVGEVVEVKERSIFNTPILIKICGYELCIGINYAKTVVVKRTLTKNRV